MRLKKKKRGEEGKTQMVQAIGYAGNLWSNSWDKHEQAKMTLVKAREKDVAANGKRDYEKLNKGFNCLDV